MANTACKRIDKIWTLWTVPVLSLIEALSALTSLTTNASRLLNHVAHSCHTSAIDSPHALGAWYSGRLRRPHLPRALVWKLVYADWDSHYLPTSSTSFRVISNLYSSAPILCNTICLTSLFTFPPFLTSLWHNVVYFVDVTLGFSFTFFCLSLEPTR